MYIYMYIYIYTYIFTLYISECPSLCEHGTCKTVKARFWPWLSGESPKTFEVFRSFPDFRLACLEIRGEWLTRPPEIQNAF